MEFESQIYVAQLFDQSAGNLVETAGPATLGPKAMAAHRPGVLGDNDYDPVFLSFDAWKNPGSTAQDQFRASVARGAELFMFNLKGPWMWPHLRARGILDGALQRGIVRLMIDRLNERFQEFADSQPGFHFVDARGSVKPEVGPFGWLDEIHPGAAGFHKVAGKFVPWLRQSCPGRFQRDWPLMAD